MNGLIALLALIVERVFGYPKFAQNLVGHPVQWYGALIDWVEKRFNGADRSPRERRTAGIVMLAFLVMAAGLTAWIIVWLLNKSPHGWVVEAVLASAFLSQRQLGAAVRLVAVGLEQSLPEGRLAVSHIVGRDTKNLDEAEVSRAAIETLAENASDGFIAPLFWLLLLGLPGIAIYKAINTADSMVGHLSDRYTDFGWASAKLDDVVNWLPARLTMLVMILAAFLMSRASGPHAWKTAWRDGPKHKSPNAGRPEATMAGALSFGLGGPRKYAGRLVDLPAMGTGERNLTAKDVRQALGLYGVTGIVVFAIVGLITLLLL